MHVGGVPGQQDTTLAVGGCLSRHVGEPGDPGRAVHPVVRPVHGDECFAELVHAGVAGVVDVSFGEDDPDRLTVLPSTEGVLAGAVATEAELRFLVHLDLGDHPAGRGIQPGEVDAGGLADQAASSVAASEILRSEQRVVGKLDVDAGVVLREAHHLATTTYGNPELADPVSQDGLEQALPQRQHVVVAGGEVADVQGGTGEPQSRADLPRREESLRDATLIQHLDGAGVKTAGSRSVDLLTGASFDDDDVDPRQRQLARQHQPSRTTSCDHHRVLGHRGLPVDPSAEGNAPIPQLLAPQLLAVTGSANESWSPRWVACGKPPPPSYAANGGDGSRSLAGGSAVAAAQDPMGPRLIFRSRRSRVP